MSSPGVRWRQPRVRQSIRTRLLVLLLGLTTISVLIVGYLGVNSVQSIGESAQQISAEALRAQAEEYLRQVTVGDAQRNDLVLRRVQRDAENVAQYAASIFERPDVFTGGAYWRAEDHMFTGSDGQYMNDETDVSDAFVPNLVDVDDEVLTVLELGAYLDFILVSTYESDPNTVAIYLGTERDVLRYYPNINIGTVVPPDFQVTQRPWYVGAAPENNPEGAVVWSPVYVDATGKGLMVTAAAPVYAGGDDFVGVVGIDATLQDISASVEEARLLGGGYSFLVDETGHAIALPEQGYPDILGRPAEAGEFGADLSEVTTEFAPVLAEMMAGSTGFDTLEVGGGELFVAYAPLESTGWSLANVVEADKVLQAMAVLGEELGTLTESLLLTRILPVSGGILVVMAVVGLLLTNRLVNPIQRLATAVQQIGAGQWDAPLPQAGNDEMGVLSRAFATMTMQLRELMESLERRVAERTADLERRAMQLEAAAEVAREATAIRDVNQLLDETVHLISERFGFYHAGVFLVDDKREYAVLRAASSEGGQRMLARGHKLAVGKVGMVGYVTGTGEPRIALDVGEDAAHFINPDLPETRSEMTLPLRVRGEIIGVLDVQSTEGAAFSDEDVGVLQTMADQLAVAIENARLLGESQRALRELELVHGEYVRAAWGDLETLPAFEYDRVEVTPAAPEFHPGVEQVLSGGQVVTIVEPEDGRSALAAPLRLRDQVIGAIGLEETDGARRWTEEEIELVEAVSSQVAMALENARLFEESRVRAEELAALNELARALTARLTVEEVLDAAYRGASRLLDTTNFYIGLYDAEKDEVAFPLNISRAEADRQITVLPAGQGLTGYVIRNRTSVLIREDVIEHLEEMGVEQVGQIALSWLGVPLMIGDRVLGVMAVQNYTTPRAYSEHDRNLLTAIASQSAIALESARLFEQTQEALAETEALYRASWTIGAATSSAEVGQALMNYAATSGVDVARVLLFEHDEQGRPAYMVVHERWTVDDRPVQPYGTRLPMEDYPLADFMDPNKPVIVEDVLTDPRANEMTRTLITAISGLRTFAMVPITVGERWIGMVFAGRDEPSTFAEELIRGYRTLAGQAGVALENIRLLEETRRHLEHITALYGIGQEITSTLDLDAILQAIADAAARLAGCEQTLIALLDAERQELLQLVGHGYGEGYLQGITFDELWCGLTGWVLRERKPTLTEDMQRDERETGVARERSRQAATGSVAVAPLKVKDQIIGTLTGVNLRGGPVFTQEHLDLFIMLAGQAAIAIENARLFEETQATLAETEALYRASRDIVVAQTPDGVLRAFTDHVVAPQIGRCVLALIDPTSPADEPVVEIKAAWEPGVERLAVVGNRWTVSQIPLLARMVTDLRVISDVATSLEMDEVSRHVFLNVLDVRAVAIVPLLVGERHLGWLLVDSLEGPYDFSAREMRLYRTLAGQAAVALESMRLFEEAQRRAHRERLIHEITAKVWASTDLESVLKTAAQELSKALGTSHALIRLGTPPQVDD